ncbi:MAG: PorP/SprF family type IX secretion system membrane protein [bacterium]|nr:PorP/SprF family type IX secretion system membrane protein [bacterium]
MMKNIWKHIASGVVIFASVQLNAQDIHYSQVQNTPLLLNPANTGLINGTQRITAQYRNQYGSVASPYSTYGLMFDSKLFQNSIRTGFLGAGISVNSDVAGDLKLGNTNISALLAYHVKLSDNNYLGAGISGGYIQRGFNDASAAQWGSQYDGAGFNGALPGGTGMGTPENVLDFGAGLNYSFLSDERTFNTHEERNFTLGVAAYHVNQPEMSFFNTGNDRLGMRFTGQVSGMFPLNDFVSMAPGAYYQRQGGQQQLVAGSIFRYYLKESSHYTSFVNSASVGIGVHYRAMDALILSVQGEFSNFFFGFSYDVNLSQLTPASRGRGGFELSLKYIYKSINTRFRQSRI